MAATDLRPRLAASRGRYARDPMNRRRASVRRRLQAAATGSAPLKDRFGMSSVPAFWQHCLESFRQELTPQQFNTWIRPLSIVRADDGYRLLAPNRFVLQWVKERFAQRITELAHASEGEPVSIALGVADAPEAQPAPRNPPAPAPAPLMTSSP